jgi:hypothetical protein
MKEREILTIPLHIDISLHVPFEFSISDSLDFGIVRYTPDTFKHDS